MKSSKKGILKGGYLAIQEYLAVLVAKISLRKDLSLEEDSSMQDKILTAPVSDEHHTNSNPNLRLSRRARKAQSEEQKRRHAQLLDDYFAIMTRIRNLEDFFERITDPELIASCIYEMNAAQQQYGYIMGRLKAEGVTHLKILRNPRP